MADIRCRYLPDVPWQEIPKLLTTHGFAEPDNHGLSAWILETAALTRLAHASLVGTHESAFLSEMSLATLSRTATQLPRGRPQTARWAFWTSFLVRENVTIHGKAPTYGLLAGLIGILLNRGNVSPQEVRTVFVGLRREVTRCATAVAQEFLTTALKPGVSEKTFVQLYKDLEIGLTPDHQKPPMIKNGKLDEEWLKTLTKTRSEILRRTRKNGPLGGEPPYVGIDQSAEIGSWTIGKRSQQGGTVHLGKGIEVPVPGIPSEGGAVGISFSRNFLDGEPFAAQLYTVPGWWGSWHSLFVAVPAKHQRVDCKQQD